MFPKLTLLVDCSKVQHALEALGVTSTAFLALWLLVASSPEDIKSAAEVGRKTDQDHCGS